MTPSEQLRIEALKCALEYMTRNSVTPLPSRYVTDELLEVAEQFYGFLKGHVGAKA